MALTPAQRIAKHEARLVEIDRIIAEKRASNSCTKSRNLSQEKYRHQDQLRRLRSLQPA